jgi:indolepyruvate decarboxylase
MENFFTIGNYLIQQLYAQGVRHIFGVPGDFVLRFYDLLTHSNLQIVNTCDEQGAGFAADAYARLRGLSAVCVTYGVGGLKIANTTAQAFAERLPVIIISGAPGIQERQKQLLLHHRVREFDTQKKVFEQLTAASTVLDDPHTALSEIDRVLSTALRYKRPVYIELPRDMVLEWGSQHHTQPKAREESDPEVLRAAVEEAVTRIETSQQPVILAGIEVHRFGLQEEVLQLARKTNIPVAATLLGKSVVGEREPFYLGIYQGRMGREEIRQYVESSDCILLLGVMMTDLDLGAYTARLDQAHCIHAVSEKLSIGYHTYENVRFGDFLHGLAAMNLRQRESGNIPRPGLESAPAKDENDPITTQQLFIQLGSFLTDNTIVIADPGDALFGAADLLTYHSAEFISPAYYASMGFAVPAAIGAQLADPKLRPLILVGDGAFQMTGMELSTAVRFGLNPIVVILNNQGYLTERYILDGPFNNILPWDYSRIPDVLGAGRSFVIKTGKQLDQALLEAKKYTESFCLLDVRLDSMDASPALRRLAEQLARRQ